MNILLEMLAVLGLVPREASQTNVRKLFFFRKRKGNEEKFELHKVGAQVPESSQWPRETIRGKGDVLMRSAAQPADDEAILYYIVSKAKEEGVEAIRANYIPTQKNKPIETLLPNCGFEQDGDSWIIKPKTDFKFPDYIKLDEE